MKKISLILIAIVVLISCNIEKNNKVVRESNGTSNHLLIVTSNDDWQGKIGDELRNVLAQTVLGLPQPEPLFNMSQVSPENFKSMFTANRNVLQINFGTQDTLTIASDVFATPQKIITITGKNEEGIVNEIQKNSQKIIDTYKKSDLSILQKRLATNSYDISKIKTFQKQGFSLEIPRNYRVVEDDGNIIWYRKHLDRGNSAELFAYTYPILSEDDENGNNIVAHRNEFGKQYVPGQIKDSYMITEEAYTPHIFDTKLDGKKAFETLGKWEVKGIYMAGPFVNYSVIDKKHNRVVVVEGIVFAPAVDKRDYMFELEAIIKTLKIN